MHLLRMAVDLRNIGWRAARLGFVRFHHVLSQPESTRDTEQNGRNRLLMHAAVADQKHIIIAIASPNRYGIR